MTRFIPYEKLSKKQKRALDAQKRGSWGDISPVTRKVENKKCYNRAKAKHSVERSTECFVFAEVFTKSGLPFIIGA